MSALQSKSHGQDSELQDDPRWALVNRIVSSEAFSRSRRLRQLLVYLSECAIRNPQSPLTEQHVGIAVFKRPAGYDTTADTVVRVRASEIRKRLKYYFLTEGLHEPLTIELPKGSYLPIFRPRRNDEVTTAEEGPADESAAEDALLPDSADSDSSHDTAEHGHASSARPRDVLTAIRPNFLVPFASLLIICSALVLWLAYQNAELRKTSGTAKATPFLTHFWTQFFQNGKQTEIVPSDAGVIAVADLLGRRISLQEYTDPAYPKMLLDPLIKDPKANLLATRMAMTGSIVPFDASVLAQLSILSGRYQIPLQVILPRNAKVIPEVPGNLILLGHQRSNPWVNLFVDRLNFRHEFDDSSRKAAIVNTSPLSGEERSYVSEFDHEDFAVAACLPKPGGNGSVLILFGGRLASIDGAASLVTDEAEMARLHARFGIGVSDPMPYFEVLLDKRSNTASYEITAYRILKQQ